MKILILPGDGIGKEVTPQAARILKAVLGSQASFEEAPIGGEGVKAAGKPLPDATLAAIRARIDELQQKMAGLGVPAGSLRALRLFS